MTPAATPRRALVVSPFCPFPPVSGGRKRALRLMETMERAGLVPHVLALETNHASEVEMRRRGWPFEQLDPPPVRYGPGTRFRQHLRRQMVLASAQLVARIAQLGPSSAVIQLEEVEALAYLDAAARCGRPVLASLHNVDSEARRFDLAGASRPEQLRAGYHLHRIRVGEARAARRAAAVICVSPADESHFRGIGAQRTILAANGVDGSLFELAPAPGEPRTALFFGQMGWEPNLVGLDRFLREGWPAVRRAVPDARLRIAGPGTERAMASRGPVEDGVDVLGLVDDIAVELARAGAVVVPIWSGGGTRLKVLEAMAAARALVATPLGVDGVGFEDGRHGLLADDPAGLAGQLVAAFEDPALGRRCGLAAREHARAYEWPLVTRDLAAYYSSLASG